VITYDLPASLPVAWEWLNDPQKRSLWEEARVFAEGWTGRSGPGLRTHGVHGDKETTVQTILDWRPFEYYTMEIAGPGGRLKMATNTVRLEPIEGGTRITDVTRAEIKPRWISRIVMRRAFEKGIRQSVERLKRMVSAAVSTGPKAEE
jgi:hypothetical protein